MNTTEVDGNAYEQLNMLWARAEDELRRFRVPYPVQIAVAKDNETLSLRKVLTKATQGGSCFKWCICHSPTNTKMYVPILESAAAVRVAMIEHYPTLRKAVIQAAEDMIPRLDEAISRFRQILDSFKE